MSFNLNPKPCPHNIQWVPCAEEASPVEGQAFCVLPLPVSTGLPVHVNAFFELSTNRRDIWHGSDLQGVGKLRHAWNICLLQVCPQLD